MRSIFCTKNECIRKSGGGLFYSVKIKPPPALVTFALLKYNYDLLPKEVIADIVIIIRYKSINLITYSLDHLITVIKLNPPVDVFFTKKYTQWLMSDNNIYNKLLV